MKFDSEYLQSQEEVRKFVQDCEGKHTQQVVYSTFHDALTQICYGCQKIRSNLILIKEIQRENSIMKTEVKCYGF